jgi:hypothetical protein
VGVVSEVVTACIYCERAVGGVEGEELGPIKTPFCGRVGEAVARKGTPYSSCDQGWREGWTGCGVSGYETGFGIRVQGF